MRTAVSALMLALGFSAGGCGDDARPEAGDPMMDAGPGMMVDSGRPQGTDAGHDGHDAGPKPAPDAGGGTDAGGGGDADIGSGSTVCADEDLGSMMGIEMYRGTTVEAADDADPECGHSGDAHDVILLWRAPMAGRYVIDTQGSGYDTILDVRDGCPGLSLACSDDGGETYQSRAELTLAADQAVLLVVDGYAGATGEFVLSIGLDVPATELTCSGGADDDRDGVADCADEDCGEEAACTETVCDDGLDNDGDGDSDCDDWDCGEAPACIETVCGDGLDNDGDEDVDCDDWDCWEAPECTETSCGDGRDDDGDDDIDCDDWDCDESPHCAEAGMCTGGTDNDGDGAADCADSECRCDAACHTDSCADFDLGSMVGPAVARGNSAGRCDVRHDPECSGATGPDVTYRWTAPAAGDYVFDTYGSSFDTVLYALDGSCTGAELACGEDDGGTVQSEIRLTLTAGQVIVLVVDGWVSSSAGDYVLNVTRP